MVSSAWGAFVVALVIAHIDADNARKKDREVSGLYPFPRVGRQTSKGAAMAFNEYIKRQGLRPFPRVGRGGNNIRPEREEVSNDQSRLWFGPRIGRSTREDPTPQWTFYKIDSPLPKPIMSDDSEVLESSPLLNDRTESNDIRIVTL